MITIPNCLYVSLKYYEHCWLLFCCGSVNNMYKLLPAFNTDVHTYAEAIWMKYIETYCNTVCTEMEGMIVYFLPVIWPVWLFRWRKGSVFLPCKLFTSIIKSFKPSQQNNQRILKKGTFSPSHLSSIFVTSREMKRNMKYSKVTSILGL